MPRRINVWLVAIGVVVALALLHVAGVLRPVEDSIRWIFLPVARGFATVGAGLGGESQSSDTATLQDQVRDLEARLRSLSVDFVKLRSLEEENQSLRKLAKFLDSSGYDHVSARIIARSTDPLTATVLIDRGARDGLEIGMAVVAEDGVLIGKLTSLAQNVSTVTLVSDARCRIAAAVSGRPGLAGLIQGEGNGVARLSLVPQNVPLKRDDVIVTAGTEEKIPANLAVGLVNDVNGKPTDPFKVATLQPLIHMSSLDLVAVLRPAVLRPQ